MKKKLANSPLNLTLNLNFRPSEAALEWSVLAVSLLVLVGTAYLCFAAVNTASSQASVVVPSAPTPELPSLKVNRTHGRLAVPEITPGASGLPKTDPFQ